MGEYATDILAESPKTTVNLDETLRAFGRWSVAIVVSIVIINFSAPGKGGSQQTADTIIENARVYTVDPSQPWAEDLFKIE